jgi:hypothetical protein
MKKLLGIGVLSVAMLAGCATQKQLVPSGGSRSDGIVKMTMDFSTFESPRVDLNQAKSAAKQRCVAWGYTDVEPFNQGIRRCQNHRCIETYEYQCIGKPEATK